MDGALLDDYEDVEMRRRGAVLFVAVTLVWAGSLWMAFWSGFSCHLSVAMVATHGADRVRQMDQQRLLKKIESGDIEYARASLRESVRLDDELIKLNREMPRLGLADMALAGLTSPGELLDLLETARKMDAADEHP